jgi:hypothetical protein
MAKVKANTEWQTQKDKKDLDKGNDEEQRHRHGQTQTQRFTTKIYHKVLLLLVELVDIWGR